jgi:NAD+ diphosphatase
MSGRRLERLPFSIASHGFEPAMDFRVRDDASDRICAIAKGCLIVRNGKNGVVLPRKTDLGNIGMAPAIRMRLGTLHGHHYSAWGLPAAPELPANLTLEGLRAMHGVLDDESFHIAGYALHLTDWFADNRYCGCCGAAMAPTAGDRALTCSACDHVRYPRIAPAIIVAVTRGNRLLLARSGRFPGQRMFSVLAGYVEPGETLEECVRREVQEEVGVRVRDIRYFGSQAWPFSGSLMIGFTAAYDSGRIRADGSEILEAHWFPPDRLPEIPRKISISRQLIDWFVDQHA